MEIKPPGLFSRGRILFGRPAQHITPDSLVQELTHAWALRGFEIYKSALIGADVALKKSGWTGLTLKIKQVNGNTEILYGAYAPSAFVRLMFMGAIPILIVNATSWKPLLREFETYVMSSPFFLGNMLPGHGPMPLPHAVANYPQGQQPYGQPPQQQQYGQPPQQQYGAPQHQYGHAPPPPQQYGQPPHQQYGAPQQQQAQQQQQMGGQPCMQCGSPMQWVQQQNRWYCGRCQQLR